MIISFHTQIHYGYVYFFKYYLIKNKIYLNHCPYGGHSHSTTLAGCFSLKTFKKKRNTALTTNFM